MIDYRSACCGRLQFRAEGIVPNATETKCGKCGEVGQPVPRYDQPLHRTYKCDRCQRTQHCERPVQLKTYCIVCGTQSLAIVAETGRRVVESDITPSAAERLALVPSWREKTS